MALRRGRAGRTSDPEITETFSASVIDGQPGLEIESSAKRALVMTEMGGKRSLKPLGHLEASAGTLNPRA